VVAVCYNFCSFVKYVEIKVHSNLQQAQRGGIPGTYSLVRSYFNILLSSAPSPEFEVCSFPYVTGSHRLYILLFEHVLALVTV